MNTKEKANVVAGVLFISGVFFLVGASFIRTAPKPIPPASTQLLIDVFQDTIAITSKQLATCLAVAELCKQDKDKVDEQIEAIFNIKKEDMCE